MSTWPERPQARCPYIQMSDGVQSILICLASLGHGETHPATAGLVFT